VLTSDQRANFEERGFVRIPEAFSRAEAAAMEERVWTWLERRYGICRTDPATWTLSQPTGLQRLKRHSVFDAVGSARTCGALDDLLGAGRWRRPREWGQCLVSFPTVQSWSVPTRVWHTDFGFLGPSNCPFGALVFSFLSDVPAGSGGTAVVSGSPHRIRKFVEGRPRASLGKMKTVRQAFLRGDPWLMALSADAGNSERIDKLMHEGAIIDGVSVRVAELCGEAGDVVIGNPWLLHAGAPNSGARPRIMRVQRVRLDHETSPAPGSL
jgi:hypothetical protein